MSSAFEAMRAHSTSSDLCSHKDKSKYDLVTIRSTTYASEYVAMKSHPTTSKP
jgi:hypothetical protein